MAFNVDRPEFTSIEIRSFLPVNGPALSLALNAQLVFTVSVASLHIQCENLPVFGKLPVVPHLGTTIFYVDYDTFGRVSAWGNVETFKAVNISAFAEDGRRWHVTSIHVSASSSRWSPAQSRFERCRAVQVRIIPSGLLTCLEYVMWTPTTREQHNRRALRYQTDLTDVEWRLIQPHLPAACETGRPRAWPMSRNHRCHFLRLARRDHLASPALGFPPWPTVYRWFAAFRDGPVFEKINHAMVMMDRERAGRRPVRPQP